MPTVCTLICTAPANCKILLPNVDKSTFCSPSLYFHYFAHDRIAPTLNTPRTINCNRPSCNISYSRPSFIAFFPLPELVTSESYMATKLPWAWWVDASAQVFYLLVKWVCSATFKTFSVYCNLSFVTAQFAVFIQLEPVAYIQRRKFAISCKLKRVCLCSQVLRVDDMYLMNGKLTTKSLWSLRIHHILMQTLRS